MDALQNDAKALADSRWRPARESGAIVQQPVAQALPPPRIADRPEAL